MPRRVLRQSVATDRRPRRALAPAALACAAALCAPAAAGASSAAYTPAGDGHAATVSVADTVAEANSLTIERSGSSISVSDRGATVDALDGCTSVSADEASCPAAPEVLVSTGAGDDAVRLTGSFGVRDQLTVDLGSGNDFFAFSPGTVAPVTVLGGPGNDVVDGGPRGDALDGGGGTDVIHGHGGADVISDGGVAAGGRGILDGGPGDDRISGGGGDDLLSGGPGDDSLDGGRGLDVFRAGPGADRVNAADGVSEQVVCGPGSDVVRTGPAPDDLGSSCERVTEGFSMRAGIGRVGRDGVVTVRVPCAGHCRVGVRVTVVDQHGRAQASARRRTSAPVRSRSGRGVVVVRLKLPPSALAELRLRRALRVRVDVRRDRARTAWISLLRLG